MKDPRTRYLPLTVIEVPYDVEWKEDGEQTVPRIGSCSVICAAVYYWLDKLDSACQPAILTGTDS